jgi:hypothetical protein
MSVIDNLRRKPTPAGQLIQAPEVLQRLGLAQAELERLQAQHGDVALDAILAVEGADGRLAALEKEIASARANVGKLKAAHGAALARDEAAILQQRASLYKTQLATVKRKLEARDHAAQELAEAFGIVARSWNTMIEASKAAKAATPVGTAWPEDGLPALIDFDGIKALVANEMYRQAGDPKLGNRQSFPGSRPTAGNEGEPDKIRPLADTLKAHTAFVLEKLTGKTPGA